MYIEANFDRSPQNSEELDRAATALHIICRRYADSAPFLINWQVDHGMNMLYLEFDISEGSPNFAQCLAEEGYLDLKEVTLKLNSGIVEADCGYDAESLHQFRCGISALRSLASQIKCDFPEGITCSEDFSGNGMYRLNIDPRSIRSLQHLEKVAANMERSTDVGRVLRANAEMVGAVLENFLIRKSLNIEVFLLDPRPETADKIEFAIRLNDLVNRDLALPEIVEEFRNRLSDMNLQVSRVSGLDPIEADLIILGDSHLKALIMERGISWG